MSFPPTLLSVPLVLFSPTSFPPSSSFLSPQHLLSASLTFSPLSFLTIRTPFSPSLFPLLPFSSPLTAVFLYSTLTSSSFPSTLLPSSSPPFHSPLFHSPLTSPHRALEKRHQRLTSDQEEVSRCKKVADERVLELEKSIALSKLQQSEATRNYDSLKEEKNRVCPTYGEYINVC